MNNNEKLLTRTEFREGVKKRDNYRCLVCGISEDDSLLDAHHIIERRLWDDGGYYLGNGATLCDPNCHMLAESTEISCNELRRLAKIDKILLPSHLYKDNEYDKWGNIILGNGRRIRGELFYDDSVQLSLSRGKDILELFDKYVKYPRTYHLPYSPGRSKDDRIWNDNELVNNFEGNRVIVTLKMDGENTTMYNDYLHARSLEGDSHLSQAYVRNLHSKIAHDIPDGWRLVGENLYAIHSIRYNDLEDYFYLFSVWDDKNNCLSWDDTLEYSSLFNLPHVPVIYDGLFNREKIEEIWKYHSSDNEGYVIRLASEFSYGRFRKSIAKYVRANHVQDSVHNWRSGWYVSDSTVNKIKEK